MIDQTEALEMSSTQRRFLQIRSADGDRWNLLMSVSRKASSGEWNEDAWKVIESGSLEEMRAALKRIKAQSSRLFPG
jgi:hypothetical protein